MKCFVNTLVSSVYWSVLVKYCLRRKNDKGATASGMGPIVTSGKCSGGIDEHPTPSSPNRKVLASICDCGTPGRIPDNQDDHVNATGKA